MRRRRMEPVAIAITLIDPVAITPATRLVPENARGPSSDRGAQLIVMKMTDSGVEKACNRYRRNQN
jgi:hypothetical protein